jgi:CheY-like chemotaxis protein
VRRWREFEKAELLKLQDKSMRSLGIIGMSANSDNATKQCALDAGMDFFISKPFKLKELLPLIQQLNLSID